MLVGPTDKRKKRREKGKKQKREEEKKREGYFYQFVSQYVDNDMLKLDIWPLGYGSVAIWLPLPRKDKKRKILKKKKKRYVTSGPSQITPMEC